MEHRWRRATTAAASCWSRQCPTDDISGTLFASPWAGAGGGVIAFRATGGVVVSGQLGTGLRASRGEGAWATAAPYGDSSSTSARRGRRLRTTAEAAYPLSNNGCEGGGGAGHANAGTAGFGKYCTSFFIVCLSFSDYDRTDGGDAYGDADLSTLYLGSGGGGGSPDPGSDGADARNVSGDGGDGGGIILVYSGTSISVSGQVDADGEAGAAGASYGGEVGAGGGGAGGSILLAAPTLTLTGDVEARGRDGARGSRTAIPRAASPVVVGGDVPWTHPARVQPLGLGFVDHLRLHGLVHRDRLAGLQCRHDKAAGHPRGPGPGPPP